MIKNSFFFSGCFDKNRIKFLISWSFQNCGEEITIDLVENLKNIGFTYATQAGISLGIDDLKIPPSKARLISDSDLKIQVAQINYKQGYLTGIEKFQQLIDTWHRTSETLKQNVIHYFKVTDVLNPVYMMAFSGARGNISQVRQLVGMRGLMSDPQGQILDFPIKSNFREGLTLTEYVISCYGARKGLVDTALKTANSGYLTRRLVDVSHHIIVCEFDCKTKHGVIVNTIIENQKIIVPLQNRLVGRILAENIYSSANNLTTSFENNKSISLPNKKLLFTKSSISVNTEIQSFKIKPSKFTEKSTTLNSVNMFKKAALVNKSSFFFQKKIQNNARILALFSQLSGIHFFNQSQKATNKFEHRSNLPAPLALSIKSAEADFIDKATFGWHFVPSHRVASLQGSLANDPILIAVSYKIDFYANLQLNKNFPLYQLILFLKHVNLYYNKRKLIALKNQEISLNLAIKIASLKREVLVRSPLTCEIKNSICQLCYGWSLAHGKLVSLGEAVGILAAQSIGEPGTQLTMRTFHTGGVFSGDIMTEIKAPFDGKIKFLESLQGMLIRTPHGKIAFLTKVPGKFEFYSKKNSNDISLIPDKEFSISANQKSQNNKNKTEKTEKIIFQIPALTILFFRNSEYVSKTQVIAEFSSMSTDREQRIQANYDLNSEIEGEVFFKNVIVHVRKKKQKLVSRTTNNLGSIWVLSGKIYNQPIPVEIFPQFGDIVDQISIIGQYHTMSPYNGFITLMLKKPTILLTNKDKLVFYYPYQTPKLFGSRYDNSRHETPLKVGSVALPIKSASADFIGKKGTKNNLRKKIFKKTNNTKIVLNHTIISFPIQSIQYKKIGYIFSFFHFKKPQLGLDRFFISNSLRQEFQNPNKLQTTFYFQSFPKQYQTQTGGILVYDSFYLSEKISSGEILWIEEESYIFNSLNSIFFKKKCDSYTEIKNLSVSRFESLKPGRKKLPKNCIKQGKNFRKWINKTAPLTFYYNSQGKTSSFSSKLYGCLEIDKISNSFSSKVKVTTNYFNVYKPFSSISKPDILGLRIHPILSIFGLLVTKSYFTKKTLDVPNYTPHTNTFHPYVLQYVTKNENINKRLLKNNCLPVLQPQFPWLGFTKSSSFKSLLNTSLFTPLKLLTRLTPFPVVNKINQSLISPTPKKQQKRESEDKCKPAIQFYNLNKTFKIELSTNLSKNLIKVKIKPGWIFFPENSKQTIQKHKCIIKSSINCCNDILFDQYAVYVECLPLDKISVQNKKNIAEKNSNLKNILNIADIYTEFCLTKNYNNLNFCNDYTKNKYLEKWYPFTRFLSGLDIIFFNAHITVFFTKNFAFLSTLLNKKRYRNFGTLYKGLILEKYIKKNKTQKKNLLIKNKVYNYKLLYFLENFNFRKNILNIKNHIPLYTYVKFKNLFFFQLKNLNNQNSSHSISFSSKNLFTPKFFILIRKIKSYSFISSFHYKQLLAKQNKSAIYSYTEAENFNNRLTNFTQLLWFNKQNNTDLFFNFPAADFSIKPYLKYKECKKNIFFKNINVIEFCILFVVPQSYSISAIKIQLISKPSVNTLKPNVVRLFSLLYNPKLPQKLTVAQNLIFDKEKSEALFSAAHSSNISNNLCDQTTLWSFLINQRNKLNFNSILYFNISLFRKLKFSNFAPQCSINRFTKSTHNTLLLSFQNSISNQTPISLTKFFSSYQGEILRTQLHITDKQTYLVLTDEDQASFSTPNLFHGQKAFSQTFLGQFIHYGTKVHENLAIPESGRVIQIEKSKIILRKAQPILFSSKGLLSVHQGDMIEKNALVLRLFYQRLKTGDIVQGIPKIEQLFEARKTNQGEILAGGLHEELEWLFLFYRKKYDPQQAARHSLEKIQQIIVNNVQKVYQSQGVTIAEKHLEIIIRQMTSKVQIITSGETNLIPGELIDLDWIEIVNKSIKSKNKKAKYKPIILGITKKSLETKSFISEASFQETTRILAKSAIERKTDFLKGLKENVILGHVIPAGTGFSEKIFDSSKPKYFSTNNYESYTIFRKIFLEIT